MPKKTAKQEDPIPCRPWPKKIIHSIQHFFVSLITKPLERLGVFAKRSEPFYQTIKMLKSHSKTMSVEEKDLLNNFLSFSQKTVGDIMIPRSNICAIENNCSQEELCEFINTQGHTRTFIYSDTLDNIEGFIHIKDLFILITNKKKFSIKKLLRAPLIATPNMRLIDLLATMQHKRTHTAIVVDEYGGTDGMVTIEDIMEEIVGRIEDEHDDDEEFKYKAIADNTLLVSARVEMDEIEEIIKVPFVKDESAEYDTIGGMVLSILGHMPVKGTIVSLTDQVTAEIVEVTPRNIKLIKLFVSPNLN